MSSSFFDNSIEYLKGVGPKRAELLKEEISVYSFSDLLEHYPFRYEDRSRFHKIRELIPDMPYAQLRGTISHIELAGDKRNQRLTAIFRDDTGEIDLVWFKGVKWIRTSLLINTEYIIFGKPSLFKGRFNIVHPETEIFADEKDQLSPLRPVYHSTEKLKNKGLDSRGISKIMKTLLLQLPAKVEETLPVFLVEKFKLLPHKETIVTIHNPADAEVLNRAQLRLRFEELFFIQLRILSIQTYRKKNVKGHVFSKVGEYLNKFYKTKLPFELTEAQKRVVKEIRKDMGSGWQMNRLLQGDVGSGKTLVALMNILIALDNGLQACLMAPTEILAMQHFNTLKKMTSGLEINVELLTGSVSKKNKKEILERLENHTIHILVGTHALIEENVIFPKLGLVVIDEQHRFGVEQRAKLWSKNIVPPHVLIMTATPIPRTLAMTLYGDLDVSVIDEMPPGRTPIVTGHRFESDRLKVIGFMKEQIRKGRQIYIVYPLIAESEKLDFANLQSGFEALQRDFPMPQFRVSIVHGQMKKEDRDAEMLRFIKGETHIMVATTVIEVGVDIPNATVMVIESAERFGLSQLHQLRGRVGRGGEQSYCILMTGDKLSEEARMRIETMVRTTDGFQISEADMKLRGPGDLSGTQQSGVLNLKMADLTRDGIILEKARKSVLEILEKDPELTLSEHSSLKKYMQNLEKKKLNWGRIS